MSKESSQKAPVMDIMCALKVLILLPNWSMFCVMTKLKMQQTKLNFKVLERSA